MREHKHRRRFNLSRKKAQSDEEKVPEDGSAPPNDTVPGANDRAPMNGSAETHATATTSSETAAAEGEDEEQPLLSVPLTIGLLVVVTVVSWLVSIVSHCLNYPSRLWLSPPSSSLVQSTA